MRLFCAIDTPSDLHPVLARASDRLRSAGAHAKWTGPGQWHVTLKFLGETDDSAVPAVEAALRRAAAAGAPAWLRLAGLGTLGGPRPRVVVARVDDPSGALGAVAAALELEMRPLGFLPENRPFLPHVTLARVRSPRNADALLESVRSESGGVKGEWRAREAVLYRSTLMPGGAEYEALARVPLGP